MPDKVKADSLSLAADASEAQLQLALDNAEIKPGTYTVFLRGKLKSTYAKNPQAIEAAQTRRRDFDTVLAQLDEQAKQLADQLAKAQQAATEQTEQITQLETAQQTVGDVLQPALTQVKQAHDRAAGLKLNASATSTQLEPVQKLIQEVQAATTAATSQLQKAQAAMQQLTGQLNDVRNQLQAAQEKIQQTEKQHQQAVEKKQRATEYAKQLDQQLADLQKNLGPAEVTSYINSPAVVLEVLPTPLTAHAPTDPVELRRGETREVSIEIHRRFGFAEAVEISLQAPEGAEGIIAEHRRIERHRTSGTLQVTADTNAKSGPHPLDVQLSLRFNGVELQQRIPLKVVVAE